MDTIGVTRKQIILSATSVAANYPAVCRARSDRERFSKLCIVVEEADETLFWLELAEDIKIAASEQLDNLKNKTEKILKVTITYRKNIFINH